MAEAPANDNIEAKRGAFHEIPVIDFKDAYSKDLEARKCLAAQVYDACVRVGFFYVRNHGVDGSVMEKIFQAAMDFFALPLEEKMVIDLNNNPHFRGYTKLMVRKCLVYQSVTYGIGGERGPRIKGRYARGIRLRTSINLDICARFRTGPRRRQRLARATGSFI